MPDAIDQLARAVSYRVNRVGRFASAIAAGDRSPEVLRDLIDCLGDVQIKALQLRTAIEATVRTRRLR